MSFLACNPNPCNNGGTCADANDNGVPECTCAEGFFGDTCDIPAGNDYHNKIEGNSERSIIKFLLPNIDCYFVIEL